jgi:hypothetical protein
MCYTLPSLPSGAYHSKLIPVQVSVLVNVAEVPDLWGTDIWPGYRGGQLAAQQALPPTLALRPRCCLLHG